MEFEKCVRCPAKLSGQRRLASVQEVKDKMTQLKKVKGILDSGEPLRLLDGVVDGSGRVLIKYMRDIKHMLVVKTQGSTREDGSFPERPSAAQRKAALFLSCDDKITEVIYWALEKVENAEQLGRLTKSLEENFGENRTVLHYAADQPYNDECPQKVAKSLKRFPEWKKMVEAKDKTGKTALHFAAIHGHINLCKYLIEGCKLNVNGKDREGITALHLAVQHKKYDMCKLLLKKLNAEVDEVDRRGMTALHFAAAPQPDSIKLCKLLIEKYKSNVNKKDRDNQNVLHFAVKENNIDLVRILCGENQEENININSHEISHMIDSRDSKGKTPLHKAAAGGNTQIMEILLTNLNKHSREINGGNESITQNFLSKADLVGETALHEAARGGHKEAVDYLLVKGSRTLAERNAEGKTALHYAVQWPNEEMAMQIAKSILERCPREEQPLLLWASSSGDGTAYDVAVSENVKGFLLKQGKPEDLVRKALNQNYQQMAWELFNRGEDITCLQVKTEDKDDALQQRIDNLLHYIKKIPVRGLDQPTTEDSLGRLDFAKGVADLFLNPYVKTPITVGIFGDWGMGKSSLMKQTESILLIHAAQLAFADLLETKENSGKEERPESRPTKIRREVIALMERSQAEGDPNSKNLLIEYQEKYHEIYKSLALMNRNEMFSTSRKQYHLEKIPAVLTTWYNAWHYQNKLEAWAGLAVVITNAIEETMTSAQTIRNRWKYAWNQHRGKIWLELILPCLFAILLAGLVAWASWSLLSRSKQKVLADLKYGSIPVTVLVIVFTVVRQVFSVLKPISDQIGGYFSLPDHSAKLGYQQRVISDIKFLKKEMGENPSLGWRLIAWFWNWFGLYRDTVKGTSIPKSIPASEDHVRMIVFVDDLDRCNDEVLLQVLSAVNLVLAACEINVILGIDKTMMARAIKNNFKDEDKNRMDEDPTQLAEKYISKIVQLPLALPDPNDGETEKFLNQQLGPVFNEIESSQSSAGNSEAAPADNSADNSEAADTSNSRGENQPVSDYWKRLCTCFIRSSDRNHVALCLEKCKCLSRRPRSTGSDESQLKRMQMRNYTPEYSKGERKKIVELRKVTTDVHRLPREWKRFLTYHRLAWNILSENKQVKMLAGWQVQLVVWIFCCWEWEEQINPIIENWEKLLLREKESTNEKGERPSLRRIVEHYIEEIWWPRYKSWPWNTLQSCTHICISLK